tara:strand:- start:760 stop:1293 length:534 start_codon:yes stop_codon:yes gene_type:complete
LKIETFDNKVPFSIRERLLNTCAESKFTLGWCDRPFIDGDKVIADTHSAWTTAQANETGILDYLHECTEPTDWFTAKGIESIVVNLVRSSDIHYIHSHPRKQVALYYVNLDWEDGWYGETLFYDSNNLKEIIYASSFVPGRIVLFDGGIPHAIRPQSNKAPKYRMTITFIFKETNGS